MGKKTKHGKSRKDKFYFLAKEAGFRARSAFKLIQLNRRFNFLDTSKVLIDLCAAPGGWMQVAAKEMPVGSLIVGVDLVPIMPIPNCKTIVADITTERCRQLLRAAVLNNKADVVLHDGAPNVGTAWNIDEYSQATLCLKAFALATEFLRKGGWFITKVFRSRDYEPLKWAVSQFFRKIRVLKPEASRTESAEIFLVGQGYLDPTSIDPKFLDPKHVFGEVEEVKSRESIVSSLLKHSAKKKKAEGYEDEKLYHETLLSEFLETDDPLKCLAKTNKVVIDRKELMSHKLTPSYLADCLADIKVLGKADVRMILNWRRKILAALEAEKKAALPKTEEEPQPEAEPTSADEEEETQKEISRLMKEEQKATKKRLKAIRKAKRKLAERIVLKMEHPGDVIEQNSAGELFSLASIGGRDLASLEEAERALIDKTGLSTADRMVLEEERAARKEILRKRSEDFRRAVEGGDFLRFEKNAEHEIDLGALESTRPANVEKRDDIYLSSSDSEDEPKKKKRKSVAEEEDESDDELVLGSDDGGSDSDEREALESSGDEDEGDDEDEYAKALAKESVTAKNGSLLTDLDPVDEETKKKRKIEAWYGSNELKELMKVDESESEDELEAEKAKVKEKQKKKAAKKEPKAKKEKNVSFGGSTVVDMDADDVTEKKFADADLDENEEEGSDDDQTLSNGSSSEKEEAETEHISKAQKRKLRRLRRPLTAEEKALATKLIQSAKSRRELLEWNFHRYRFFEEEDNLPDWFVNDEKKHMRKAPPLDDAEKLLNRPVQGKTLKKAEEARARKKAKMAKRLQSVRKRAENLPDGLTEKETWDKVKAMYKNAGLLKKKRRPITYVVNTKAGARNNSKPSARGAKVKLVDRRMKSDLRGQARAAAKRGRKAKGGRGRR